jgi:hypothetical protein
VQASIRTQTTAGNSVAVPLNWLATPFSVTAVIAIAGGTATCKLQYTSDELTGATDTAGTGLTWLDHATLTGVTATQAGNIAFPVTAVRTNVSAISGATVTTTIRQAGNP